MRPTLALLAVLSLSGCGAWIGAGYVISEASNTDSRNPKTKAPESASASVSLDQSTDRASPIAIPFSLSDALARPQRAIIQFAREPAEPPQLPDLRSFAELDALLADPAQRARFGIITEIPRQLRATVGAGSSRSAILAPTLNGQIPSADFAQASLSISTTAGIDTATITRLDSGRLELAASLPADPIPGSELTISLPLMESRLLPTSEAGNPYRSLWRVFADTIGSSDVRIRVTPFNGQLGTSSITPLNSVTPDALLLEAPASPLLRDNFDPRNMAAGRIGAGATGPSFLAITDFNGRDLALYLPDNFGRLPSTPSLSIAIAGASFRPVDVAAGDLNQDGLEDLAIASSEGKVFIHYQASGSFSPTPDLTLNAPGVSALLIGDANSDTIPDLLLTDAVQGGQRLSLLLQDPSKPGQLSGFSTAPLVSAGQHVLALGDAGQEGFRDIVVAVASSVPPAPGPPTTQEIVLFEYLGAQAYRRRFEASLGNPKSISIRDLDGDTRSDLIIGAQTGVVIYRSGGGPLATGAAVETLSIGANLRAQAAGSTSFIDLSGKGRPALIASFSGENTIGIFPDQGRGSEPARFLPEATDQISVANGPGSIVQGDFLGEGLRDLAIISPRLRRVTILTQGGDRFPLKALTRQRQTSPALDQAIGDLNGDGLADIAQNNNITGSFQVLFQANSTSLSDRRFGYAGGLLNPGQVSIGDINGDGRNELVISALGSIPGQLPPPGPALPPALSEVILVALPRPPPGLGGPRPAGLPTLSPGPGQRFFGHAIADLNSDGRNDLAVTIRDVNSPANGLLAIFLQQADGNMPATPSAALPAGLDPGRINARDLDGDGRCDLALVNAGSELRLYRQDPDGSIKAAGILTTGPAPDSLAFGRLLGSSAIDLVVADGQDGRLRLYEQTSALNFAPPITLSVGLAALSVRVGDLSGDGLDDIATAEPNASAALPNPPITDGDSLVLFFQTRSGGFRRLAIRQTFASEPRSIALGDLNGDGELDLLLVGIKDIETRIFHSRKSRRR